jgi:hypothetical protein
VIWLYISIPVYDAPMNYKGWIKESDTVLYTKDKINSVQGDVKVKKGWLYKIPMSRLKNYMGKRGFSCFIN